ncbi:restriction endonuclease subunit S [Leuconostoc mesenteroides]|uniref:restriction endonuclease subunit S n=1 Tax=Leuconostoc mesenteroides TaxID=1245 RepID=UPI001CBE5261|nr:restriction endonuclease subunit S [Leuconostoc mesenteroides]MBZ1507133.1 restriction endonuclease subunit S [Leuconostoc mesenteroides]
MSKKTPQIRFKGFTDDWEERKLGDVVGEIQSGNRLPKDSLTNGDVPYVVAQTKNDGVFKKIARGTLDYNGNPMKLFPGNSISFSIDNPEAMFYRNAEFYTSNIMRVIHEDHLTHEQYVFILENMKRFIRGYDWSRKFSGPVVSNLEYLQPSEEEQQKIGSFFKQLDDTIALHQRKLDLLKEQKKGFLQKMFPKNGAKVPELRFSGFADDWEERKLGEHSNILTGGTPKTSMSNYWNPKEIPWMSSGEVNKRRLNETDNMISKEGLENSSARWVKENSIVIALAGQGKTRGTVAVNNIPLTTNQSIAAIEPYETLNFEFIFQNLSKRYDELRMMSSGDGTRGGLNKKIIYDIIITAPILEEQQKIGSFFKQLDDTIVLHQRKLDLLKEQKKGFLQKMFVS